MGHLVEARLASLIHVLGALAHILGALYLLDTRALRVASMHRWLVQGTLIVGTLLSVEVLFARPEIVHGHQGDVSAALLVRHLRLLLLDQLHCLLGAAHRQTRRRVVT